MSSKIKLSNNQGDAITLEHGNTISSLGNRTIPLGNITHKVNSIAELRATSENPEYVHVTGYYSADDGAFGSHFFKRIVSTGQADNGGTLIINASGTLYELQYDGAVNVKWFGVDSTGVTNETAKFIIIDSVAMSKGSEIYADFGYYSIDNFPTSNVIGEGILRVGGVDQPSNSRFQTTTNSARSIVKYETPHTVRISTGIMSFEGFRAKGQYLKKPTKVLTTSSSVVVDNSVGGNLGLGFTTRPQQHWYAVFACANEKDSSVTFVTVPYFRVHSIDAPANQMYLMAQAGEGIHGTSGGLANYNYSTSELAGSEILYCSETVNGVANVLSGATTIVTAASASSLVVSTLNNINVLDYVLVAPKYDHYRYCGSFYEDTAEIRNISDSGSLVMSKGIYNLNYPSDGTATTYTRVDFSGYIPPLATGVITRISGTLNIVSGGVYYGTSVSSDSSNHEIHNSYTFCTLASGVITYVEPTLIAPFAFGQYYFAKSIAAGSFTKSAEQIHISGWIEN